MQILIFVLVLVMSLSAVVLYNSFFTTSDKDTAIQTPEAKQLQTASC